MARALLSEFGWETRSKSDPMTEVFVAVENKNQQWVKGTYGFRQRPSHAGPLTPPWPALSGMYLEPLLLSQRVTIVHLLAVAGAAAKHLLLLLLTGQTLHLSVILDDPRGQLILFHQARLPLGVSGLLAPTVEVHALGSSRQVRTEGERCQHRKT